MKPSDSAVVVPTDDDRMLTREQAAAALTSIGYPTSISLLNKLASKEGEGVDRPAFSRWGKRVLYRWGDLKDWANKRLGHAHPSASAHYHARQGNVASIRP